ncbi:MAG: hypothetical protein HS114_28770 [Anaerolineales bacterium]|nr:hypothetical protein [Anaerolineales bacterium]
MKPQAKPQPKLTFESKITTPKLSPKPGVDELGKWYCDQCGGGNPDSRMFCQWC